MIGLRGLSKSFPGAGGARLPVLRGIDLELETGSFAVVAGANGAGKSTLLGAVAGTVTVEAGRIILGGREVTGWPTWRRAPLIGRVFQDPGSGTAPEMTLAENLRLAETRGRRRGLGRGLDRRRLAGYARELAGLGMGLEGRLSEPVSHLSGGQRQALTLLMAAWGDPVVLLLDEHTAALDPQTEARVLGITRRLVGERRLTALAVTHRVELALALGERLLVLRQGRIAADFAGERRRRLTAAELLDCLREEGPAAEG